MYRPSAENGKFERFRRSILSVSSRIASDRVRRSARLETKLYQNKGFKKMYQKVLTTQIQTAIIKVSNLTKVRNNTKKERKKMIYGYCRVSTQHQSLERQRTKILRAYPEAKLFEDKWTGREMRRPNWDKLRKQLRKGDTVVFDSVSRMSRSADEGVKEYEELFASEINLVFIEQPSINTETYRAALKQSIPMTGTKVDPILKGVNDFLINLAREQVRAAFDEAEHEVIERRRMTKEGIAERKRNDLPVGRASGTTYETKKSKTMKEKIRKMAKAFDGNMTDSEIIETLKLARNTYYKYKREIADEL